MIVGLREDDAIDQNAWYLHLTWIERICCCDAFDLRDDEAARILRCHCGGEVVERESLALHGDIAVWVASGPADECDVDGKRLVAQPFLAIDLHQLDQILGGHAADLSALLARIDEGAQSYLGDRPGPACSDLAIEMGNTTEREIVGLDLIVERQLAQFGHQAPVAANHALQQMFVSQAVKAALLAIAGRCSEHQGEAAGMPIL